VVAGLGIALSRGDDARFVGVVGKVRLQQ